MKNKNTSPETSEETLMETYELDLPNGLVADVKLYRDMNFKFGPYIITADVESIDSKERSSSTWNSTSRKDNINSQTKKTVAEAFGMVVLDITYKPDEEEKSEFQKALREIKS